MLRGLRFILLFFCVGVSSVQAIGLDFVRNVTLPQVDDFNMAIFEKVLMDTQEQARFAQKILEGSYSEPATYQGTIDVNGYAVEYNAGFGSVKWTVTGSGLQGEFDAIDYAREHVKQLGAQPDNLIGIGVVIVVIGGTCAYMNWVATNNCVRACGPNGVQSTSFTCGASTSTAGCVCNPNIKPRPTPGPYPGGPNGTGPFFNGYELDPCSLGLNTPGQCDEVDYVTDSGLGTGVLGQGWLRR